METTQIKAATDAVLLATYLEDAEFNELIKSTDFREYLKAQRGVVARLLKSGFSVLNHLPVSANPPTPGLTVNVEAISAAPAKGTGDLLQEITKIFAEKTGYPQDMLEPGLDLEADLGLDSVKQIEIHGLIRQKFGLGEVSKSVLKSAASLRELAALVEKQMMEVAS